MLAARRVKRPRGRRTVLVRSAAATPAPGRGRRARGRGTTAGPTTSPFRETHRRHELRKSQLVKRQVNRRLTRRESWQSSIWVKPSSDLSSPNLALFFFSDILFESCCSLMREEFFFFFSYESLGRLVSVYVQIRVIYEKHLRESMLFSSSFRENIFYPLEVKLDRYSWSHFLFPVS